MDFTERRREVKGFLFINPEIGVIDVASFFNKIEVESGVGIFFS